MTLQFLLVRHGLVPGVQPPAFRGQIDLELTPVGVAQAEATRDYLRALGLVPALCYSSPLQRCMRTAEIILEPSGQHPLPAPELLDIDYGDWQGKSWDEVNAADPDGFAAWRNTPDRVVIPGGEGLASVRARLMQLLHRLQLDPPDGPVLLLGHESVNRVLLLTALGLPLSRYWRLRQAPCCINRLTHADDAYVLECLNETAHLLQVNAAAG